MKFSSQQAGVQTEGNTAGLDQQYLACIIWLTASFLCQRWPLQLEFPPFLPIILQYSSPQATTRCCFNINAALLPALASSCLWKQQFKLPSCWVCTQRNQFWGKKPDFYNVLERLKIPTAQGGTRHKKKLFLTRL